MESNLTDPPDLLPCVLEYGAEKPQCYFHPTATVQDKLPASLCHDNFECEFRLPWPLKLPAIIMFFAYDYGILGNDFVDDGDNELSSDEETLEELQKASVKFIQLFAPSPLRMNEHLRLERFLKQTITPYGCVEGCQLTQGLVTIQPVDSDSP